MVKMNKKDLKDIAISLSAYYCGGNVYNHENIAYYLSNKEFDKVMQYANANNEISKLIDKLNKLYYLPKFNDNYSIVKNQIAYSCGTYGNSGQLIKYSVIARNANEVISTFYTYYC